MHTVTPEPITPEPAEGVEISEEAPENSHQKLRKAIEEKDFDRIVELGNELGIPNIEILVTQWRDFSDNEKVDGSGESDHVQTVWDTLNPEKMFDRATNVDRIKGTMGHNLGDVINVFPFQAGSVPFLTPIFQKGVDALEGLNPTVKEMAIFFAIMLFSMFADNYVACKIGLELLPDKPQIALIAAIQGGSMTAIGNMANVAQYSLDDFPLAASLGKALWHADNILLGLAWSQALGVLSTGGIGVPPTPKAAEGHASLGGVGGQQNRTRRGFFRLFTGGESEGPTAAA